MSNIHIITVATKPGGYLKWLEQSCKRNGTKLTILGMGTEWKGYISKYILMNEYLNIIPEDDIICFVDAYDVIMLQNIEILKDKFINHTKNTDYKLICAVDTEDIPSTVFKPITKWFYGIEQDQNHIINSGTYIGTCKFIKKMYKDMIEIYNSNNLLSDDQFLLNNFYITHKNEILLDINYKFFLCEFYQNIIHIKKNSDDYVFLHRYGNGEMISALIQYGYKFDLNEINTLFTNEIKSLIKKASNRLKNAFEKTTAKN